MIINSIDENFSQSLKIEFYRLWYARPLKENECY